MSIPTNKKRTLKLKELFVAAGSAATLVIASFPVAASAAQITNRSLTIGNSVASASTSYTFNFTVPSGTVLQSASFDVCTTASGACTTPAGFSEASATLASQPVNLGDASGWTVNTATAGSLRVTKSGNSAAPTGAQTVSFANVVNPSATNATFFVRITTYSDAAWTTAVDAGNVASSTAGQVTVTASIDEAVSFTLGSTTVPLGTLTNATTGKGTSTMTASTNAATGYSIAVNGTTLTSADDSIAALASPTASGVNSNQFGINLMSNTTPVVGSSVSGTGSGAAAAGYNTADSFKFVSGETVASAAAPTDDNTYTVSYIANVTGSKKPGAYQALLNYVTTANF